MTELAAADKSTYLTFGLGEELFALKVNNVREVLDVGEVTHVPRMPDFMRGVINLRGSVVPVVDMRRKLGMEAVPDTVNTCIIVVEVDAGNETLVIGALADSVKAVFELAEDDIEPPPRIGTSLDSGHILGMGKHEDGFLIILDIDRVFSAEDLSMSVEEEKPKATEYQAEAV
jgi:chemotaxis signal transduction protein